MGEAWKDGRTDLRVVKTREAIQSAFERLLETTGYSDLTVSSIAREARVSRKTFYAHYSSVDDLLELMAQKTIDEIANEIQPEGEQLTVDEWVAEFTRTTLTRLRDNAYLSGNIVQSMPRGAVVEMVRKPLERLCEKELSKRGLEIVEGHGYVLSFFIGGLGAAYETWVALGHGAAALDEAANLIAQAATQGVGKLITPAKPGKGLQ